jgi:hypothetical protein
MTGQVAASVIEADNQTAALGNAKTVAQEYANYLKVMPKSVKTSISVDTSMAYEVIRQVIDYANGQTAVIHVTATNPITGATMGGRQAFASGTDYVSHSGSYLVGEQGPERVILPRGAAVQNASQTRAGSGGGGTTVVVNVNAGAVVANKWELGRTITAAIAEYTSGGGALVVSGKRLH